MRPEEREAFISDIKAAFITAMEERHKALYVEAEEHFLHHQALRNFIKTCNSTKSLVIKIVLSVIITGFFALLSMGLAHFVGQAAASVIPL